MNRGGADTAPPWYLSFEASEEIGAKHNYCDDFSDDYFEVYNISVAQNLTILETIMRSNLQYKNGQISGWLIYQLTLYAKRVAHH